VYPSGFQDLIERLDLESLWLFGATAVILWSLMATGLAERGHFRPLETTMASVLAVLGAWAFARWERGSARPSDKLHMREMWHPGLLGLIGLLLFSWPAEHFPLLGDSAIYPNTAAVLIRTGGLSWHYDPLEDLTKEQKELFYIPADRQIPGISIRSYRGLLYGAYYVLDPERNQIISSRQPVAIVWMGALGILAGPRGMLYTTPLFGTASLVTVYLLGRRVLDHRAGVLGALWLLLSFLQLYFSRASYAEAVGQFFVLIGLYGLARALQTGWIGYSGLGMIAWATAFAARIEVILVLPALGVFLIWMACRYGPLVALRDGLLLILAAGIAIGTLNWPYAGATAELWLASLMPLLGDLRGWMAAGLLGAGLLLLALVGMAIRYWRKVGQWLRYGCAAFIWIGVGYALVLRPWVESRGSGGGHAELMPMAALYLSPILFGLAGLGGSRVVLQWPASLERWWLLLVGGSFGMIFFWRYTTARVYPVALRRLMPEVLPVMVLLAAWGLRGIERQRRWHQLGHGLGYAACLWLMGVSGPYWVAIEGYGTWRFLQALEQQLPADAVVLVEPLHGDAVAGWFAAPLWSFWGRSVLLLNREIDGELLRQALNHWRECGKSIYVLAQHDPETWWPGSFPGHPVGELWWGSTLIGQSITFPPVLWRFWLKITIYRLDLK